MEAAETAFHVGVTHEAGYKKELILTDSHVEMPNLTALNYIHTLIQNAVLTSMDIFPFHWLFSGYSLYFSAVKFSVFL